MTIAATANQYIGRRAVDPQGSKIGLVGQVYLDDETGRPDWATVNTGLFGTRENFVPLRGSRIDGDDLVLPFDKDVVKDSPEIADSRHLDLDEEQSLYASTSSTSAQAATAQNTNRPPPPPAGAIPGSTRPMKPLVRTPMT